MRCDTCTPTQVSGRRATSIDLAEALDDELVGLTRDVALLEPENSYFRVAF